MERFPGADSSTLTIPSIQMSDEGSYRCTVSNCAGSDTSDSATLTLGELKFMPLLVYANEHGKTLASRFDLTTEQIFPSLVPRPSPTSFLVAYVTFEPPSDKCQKAFCHLSDGVQRSRM